MLFRLIVLFIFRLGAIETVGEQIFDASDVGEFVCLNAQPACENQVISSTFPFWSR